MSAVVQGLLQVAEQYDGFVFDQFGVLHDGNALYPNVTNVLQHLHSQGKSILVLSNSGRSANANLDRLVSLGIDGDLIDDVVTSGEVAKAHHLRDLVKDMGANCYHIASPNEASDELSAEIDGLQIVGDLNACNFVYLSGMPANLVGTWQTDLLPHLISAGKPLLCSNPDFAALGGAELVASTGMIAKGYEEAGGKVIWVGKPYPFVYDIVQERLKACGCIRPLFVGDSYDHDVVGAHNAGFDTFLVLTGIHQALFDGVDIMPTAQSELFEGGVSPTWVSRTL
ncbi:MAG: TIGR01459 family HAD-type hydrolase [Alphaproteobacteria bacterium]|nr:TIGR01459 family HAD-type hydrolase [Alphaproteobacteria bacterium]MBT4082192.1 TIGR01459 family HAD-type hydrolase [Alphaproteobacteria bacterium]MBT4545017.1 TIGR01459 family HAD-type hydrolase [Alphaproteobacteria bacterium]MBT7745800.1 TIGR01459 family HAD-type hydrolase [Alphaproteobacteria bacterium]